MTEKSANDWETPEYKAWKIKFDESSARWKEAYGGQAKALMAASNRLTTAVYSLGIMTCVYEIDDLHIRDTKELYAPPYTVEATKAFYERMIRAAMKDFERNLIRQVHVVIDRVCGDQP